MMFKPQIKKTKNSEEPPRSSPRFSPKAWPAATWEGGGDLRGGRWKGQRQIFFRRGVPATVASCALLMGSAGQVRGQASLASFGEHGLGCPGVQEWRKGVG